MKLKVPKTERKRSSDSRLKRFFKRFVLVVIVVALLGLAASHLFALITGNALLAVPENTVAGVVTPIQTGFSSVVDWVVDYLYKLKLRSRIELEYNNLKQENEQLVYDAMALRDGVEPESVDVLAGRLMTLASELIVKYGDKK